MQENVLQKMMVWNNDGFNKFSINKEKSLIIEETVIDLNKKQKDDYGRNYDIVHLDNKAFDGCRANKLIFKKNDVTTIYGNSFNNFIGLKKLEADRGQIKLHEGLRVHKTFEINNLPNLEEINLPGFETIDRDEPNVLFNNLPKLRKIIFGKITFYQYSSSGNNHPGIFKNIPNLENVYVEEI